MKKVKYLLGIIVGLVIMSFPMFVSAKTITLNDVYTEMEKTKTEWCKNCTVTKGNNTIKIGYGYSNWVSTFTYKEDLGVI